MTNGNFSNLIAGVVRVGIGHRQRIEENRSRFLKGHAVLALIRLSFLRIPLINHGPSLPQSKPRSSIFSVSNQEQRAWFFLQRRLQSKARNLATGPLYRAS